MRLNADNCYSMTMVEVIDISDISEAPPPKSKPSPQYLKLHISLPSTHISTSLTDQAMSANKPRPKSLSPTPGKHRNKKVSSNLIEWAPKDRKWYRNKSWKHLHTYFTNQHQGSSMDKDSRYVQVPPPKFRVCLLIGWVTCCFHSDLPKTQTHLHCGCSVFTPTSELHLNCFERYLQKR